jgi:hypothetical protein
MAAGWVERDRAHGLHPITAAEVPTLEAMGRELRRLREAARLSRPQLAQASLLSARFIRQLEVGAARARLSSLAALAAALAPNDPDAALVRLAELASDTIVPPSTFSERRERNRERREARAAKLAARALPVAELVARRILAEELVGYRLVPTPPRDRSRRRPGQQLVLREPSKRAWKR